MYERTNIRLSAAERNELETVVADRNSPQKHVWRAKIVLLTADGHGTAEIMRATAKAKTVIWSAVSTGRDLRTFHNQDFDFCWCLLCRSHLLTLDHGSILSSVWK